MHYHEINDENGDLSALIPFCSDSCHVEWCRVNDVEYGGWNGAHEGADYNEYCASCGVIAHAGDDDACEHQRGNVVVNRFTTEDGETCEHGKWIQLPRERVDY
jgi:hypothetical protein